LHTGFQLEVLSFLSSVDVQNSRITIFSTTEHTRKVGVLFCVAFDGPLGSESVEVDGLTERNIAIAVGFCLHAGRSSLPLADFPPTQVSSRADSSWIDESAGRCNPWGVQWKFLIVRVCSWGALLLAGICSAEGTEDVLRLHSSIQRILFQHYIQMFLLTIFKDKKGQNPTINSLQFFQKILVKENS
jgi:hypothetical protein